MLYSLYLSLKTFRRLYGALAAVKVHQQVEANQNRDLKPDQLSEQDQRGQNSRQEAETESHLKFYKPVPIQETIKSKHQGVRDIFGVEERIDLCAYL